MTDPETRRLIDAAIAVARNAYAPYSNFHVGAALLTTGGEIITGCNVENASYGLTICAERNALFAAVARGVTSFRAVAIVADGEVMPFPCGACRQVLNEFCAPETPVYIAAIREPEMIKTLSMAELLPYSFKFER